MLCSEASSKNTLPSVTAAAIDPVDRTHRLEVLYLRTDTSPFDSSLGRHVGEISVSPFVSASDNNAAVTTL